ncbi:efflux RND transporter periplasmic adaptor subunit [Qiania dongpingensis]|uniref:Efflux RND transporter periplasmic adaptor subunit n=1 Tax=Qiania dongpingensis TaxID=2763669 RepID=A0A7G9G744_9FIRM|nr:efflux RND transporter periplasmic adaptor subunit [Qiania dongpingensis]QNM06626.1 efflux RND transporter periplasmic adaptor subunit [Qiania dongpingensis]
MEKKQKLAVLLAFIAIIVMATGLLTGMSIRRIMGTGEEAVPVYSVEGLRKKEWSLSVSVPVTIEAGGSSAYYYDSDRPVEVIYVEKGQEVEAGTPLFKYDSSAPEGELQGAELSLENEKFYLEELGGYLEELKQMKPVSDGLGRGEGDVHYASEKGHSPMAGGLLYIGKAEKSLENQINQERKTESEGSTEPGDHESEGGETTDTFFPEGTVLYDKIDKDSIPFQGDGTIDTPYCYCLKKGGEVSSEVLVLLMRIQGCGRFYIMESEDLMKEPLFIWNFDGKAYEDQVQKETESEDESSLAGTEESSSLKAEESTGSSEGTDEQSRPDFEGEFDEGMLEEALGNLDSAVQGFTKEELAQMVRERSMEYEKLELAIRKKEKQILNLKETIEECTVIAKGDGTVQEVLGIEEAVLYGQPMLIIKEDSGYHLEGQLNEILAAKLKEGDKISLPATADGKEISVSAEILSIDKEPEEEITIVGNPNLSYYRFTANLENTGKVKAEELSEALVPMGEKGEGAIVLPSSLIAYENGTSYVYAMDQEGRLKKRSVETGRSILGTDVEVLSGISLGDYLAEPKADGVEEGKKAKVVYGEEMEIGTKESAE